MKKYKVAHHADMGFSLVALQCYPSGDPAFWQQTSKYYTTERGIKDHIKSRFSAEELSEVDCSVLELMAKKRQARFLLSKVEHAEAMLSEADNNLRYITALRNLYFWMNKLHMMQDYLSKYDKERYFERGFVSFYDKVYNSLQDYKYGNKPF